MTETKNSRVCAIQCSDSGHIKVGVSSNVEKRLYDLQRANAETLSVIALSHKMPSVESFPFEKKIHKECHDFRMNGEWFDKDCLPILKEVDGLEWLKPLVFDLKYSELQRGSELVVSDKIAMVFFKLYFRKGVVIDWSQTQIAEYLNFSRSTVSRTFGRFLREGIIKKSDEGVFYIV